MENYRGCISRQLDLLPSQRHFGRAKRCVHEWKASPCKNEQVIQPPINLYDVILKSSPPAGFMTQFQVVAFGFASSRLISSRRFVAELLL